MWIIIYAPVVEVSKRVSLFFSRLGRAGWGYGCQPWFVTNQTLRCCHKIENENGGDRGGAMLVIVSGLHIL